MPIPDALSLLIRTPLFQGADRDTLAGLAGPAQVMTFGRGDAVFRAGDPADTLFIVAVGSVRTYRVGRGGRELTLGIDSSRQVLEPASVLGGETRHAAHAQALATPTVLLRASPPTLCGTPSSTRPRWPERSSRTSPGGTPTRTAA